MCVGYGGPNVSASQPGQDRDVFSAGLPEQLKRTHSLPRAHLHTASQSADARHIRRSVCLSKNFTVMVGMNASMDGGLALPVQVGTQSRARKVSTPKTQTSV